MAGDIIALMKLAERNLQRRQVSAQRIHAADLKTAKSRGRRYRVTGCGFTAGGIVLLDKPVFRIDDRQFLTDIFRRQQRRLERIP